ncbi:MAG TPA: ABC transporter permease [Vicinamibacterales bacterium]|nr:ABC transporter permease [Vicinamibacterales bacterium]
MTSDLRYAVRVLTRTPSLTWPAVGSLALAIAVNTTMFGVVNAVLLRPLGGPGDGELVRIGRSQRGDQSFRSANFDEYQYLRDRASSFAGVAGHQIRSVVFGGSEGPQPVSAEFVTGGYFSVLGVAPRIGRNFGPAEDRPGVDAPVAIISDRFWRRRFGADPAVVGRSLTINHHDFAIVGIAPGGFVGTFPGVDTDIWLPAVMAGTGEAPGARGDATSIMLVGRLKPGVTQQTASAELGVLVRRMLDENPAREPDRGFVIGSARGAHPLLARFAAAFLLLLTAVVSVVLLLACANVASLLLARASARRSELATRLALGAGRRRIVVQLLIESGLLAIAGAAAGLGLSAAALGLLNGFSPTAGPTGGPIFLNLQIDGRVLLFTALMCAAATLGFGLAPALQASRVDLVSLMRDARGTFGRRSRLRGGLLVVQVALSCLLLIAAALLFRSLRNVSRVDVGFDPDQVVIATFDLQPLGYDRTRTETFFEDVLQRARHFPGVESAALADFVPMGSRGSSVAVTIRGFDQRGGPARLQLPYNRISDDYFSTLRRTLITGRDFALRDTASAPPVAIVNETMSRRYWPADGALGKHVKLDGEPEAREIVGVVTDAMYASFAGQIEPFVYLPARQRFGSQLTIHVRTAAAPSMVLADIRRMVREIDGTAAPLTAEALREAMGFTLIPARIAQGVFGVTGVIGLLLAAGGLYGLVCYTLTRRLKEIGIRVALGASRRNIFRVVVGGAIRLTLIGVVLGVGLAAAGTRFIASFLYGLSPLDPVTFGGIALLLIVVTLFAGYAGARRGLRLDPVVALRHE